MAAPPVDVPLLGLAAFPEPAECAPDPGADATPRARGAGREVPARGGLDATPPDLAALGALPEESVRALFAGGPLGADMATP